MESLDLTQTFQDLAQDLESLDALASSAQDRLRSFRDVTQTHPDFFQARSRETVHGLMEHTLATYEDIRRRLKSTLDQRPSWQTIPHTEELIALKQSVQDELRTLQGIVAGLITAMDWQSPSYDHSLIPQAGRRTGTVVGTENDYTRDVHPDATAYERAFTKEYIHAGLHVPIHTYAMSSGMAAFATIVEALRPEVKEGESIVAGHGIYFENKKVLRQAFDGRIQWVAEMDQESVIKTVAETQPRIIFLDTLCNTESIEMPDLERLIPAIAGAVTQTTYLVLDNSALALTCQPFLQLPHFSKLRLIVMESLNKFHQFGFDRVTGGIVWTGGLFSTRLYGTRMHFGSNIPVASVFALPEPDAKRLAQRLVRLGRNAQWLAERLQEDILSLKSRMLSHITYPGLSSYPGSDWTKARPFHGTYFVIRFKPEYCNASRYEALRQAVMREAKKARVDLNAGTSFGFDTTRVYLTARYADEDAKPFLRVAVGTESMWELERIHNVFKAAITSLG